MATFVSNLYPFATPFRGATEDREFEVTGSILIKAGTKLTNGDILKFARLGNGVRVFQVLVSADGDLDDGTATLAGSLGFGQVLDKAGQPVVVDDKTGVKYTSPSTNSTALLAANVAAFNAVLQAPGQAILDAAANQTTGPVDVSLFVTTSAHGDAAADTTLRITLRCLQRATAPGEFSGSGAEWGFDPYA